MLYLKGHNSVPLSQVGVNEEYPRVVDDFEVGESERNSMIRGLKGYHTGYSGIGSVEVFGILENDFTKKWKLGINNDAVLSLGGYTAGTVNIEELGEGKWELRNLSGLDEETDELIMSVLRDIDQVGEDFIWNTERDDGGILGHSGSTTMRMKPFFRDRFTNSEVIMKAINKFSTDLVLAIRDKA